MYSVYDEYRDNGINAIKAEKDVFAGINRVGEFFKRGKIKISNRCTNLIKEIERYHWVEPRETISGMAKPQPYHKDCHLCNCLQWIVMSRQEKSAYIEPQLNPNSPWGRYLESKKEQTGFVYGRPD